MRSSTVCARPALRFVMLLAVASTMQGPAVAGEAPVSAGTLTPTPANELPPCRCAPAGTPIVVEIDELLISDERKPGDGFALHLAEPVTLDGQALIPAGTPGRGEIVHAAKAHGGGQPGELLLAARYLQLDGRRIPLRGMKFGQSGTDRSSTALATALAVGVFAQFIHGGEVRLPPGTRATAKLAVDVDASSMATPDAPAADPSSTPTATAVKPTQE